MQRAMIRWRVKPAELETELQLLAELYDQMRDLRPSGLVYDTYRLDDGLSFVAFAEMPNGMGVLGEIPAFHRYRGTLDARCDQAPTVTVLHDAGLLYSAS